MDVEIDQTRTNDQSSSIDRLEFFFPTGGLLADPPLANPQIGHLIATISRIDDPTVLNQYLHDRAIPPHK